LSLKGRDIISLEELTDEEILQIFVVADELEPVARGEKKSDLLKGKVMGMLFFEPSTRTRLSFESAMQRLGGSVIGFVQPEISSIAKGETLADTIRTVEKYCDVIVLRHSMMGSARVAAELADVPVINAGDGAGHHPTQTLLDIYTIKRILGTHKNLNMGLLGDLRYGRTAHSLAYAASRFDNKLFLISPPTLGMPKEIIDDLLVRGKEISVTSDLRGIIPQLDVLYVTRIQKERFPDPAEYAKIKGTYRIDLKVLEEAKSSLCILHPLPRVEEIDTEIDSSPYAKYFDQVFYGLVIRMAILSLLLGD
jgi:aspartate carbamoyltransferase catalytic subunit